MIGVRARLARGVRRVQRAFGIVRPAILMYHRVAEPVADPWGLAVSPANFEQHLRLLREHAEVVPLSVLADRQARGVSTRGMVAITFDDGYPDVFEVALPLLHEYQCPATVFLPTGYMADQRPFWWDVLSLIFLQLPEIPQELDLQFGGHRLQIALGSAEARRAAHDQIWALLKLQDKSSRCEAIATIEAWAGASDPSWARAHRCVTADEAMRAHSTGFLDLGAHTRTHPSLPSLATDRQKEEIAGSVAVLREMIGSEMSSFAYPYGDYDPQVVDAVREAGIRCACTTRHHRVGRRAPLLELPRLYVQNVDASGFSSEILAHA